MSKSVFFILLFTSTLFSQTVSLDALKNLEYKYSGGKIKFTNGTFRDEASGISAALMDEWIAEGDLDGDGLPETVTEFYVNLGSQTIYQYLAVVQNKNGKPECAAFAFLGEGKITTGIHIAAGQIVLDMITHDDNDPLCCPTKPIQTVYAFTGGELQVLLIKKSGLSPEDIKFDFVGLTDRLAESIELREQNIAAEPPFMNGVPQHVKFLLGSGPYPHYFDPREPQLRIFSVADYRALFKGSELSAFDKRLAILEDVVKHRRIKKNETVEIFPAVEASQIFSSNEKYLNFKTGKGIRFITDYAQENTPITNNRIFYTFQGLTNDKKYYIVLYYPVSSKKLPADFESTPKNIKLFLDKPLRYKEYLSSTVGKLNRVYDKKFNPDLTVLDKLIESLVISEPLK